MSDVMSIKVDKCIKKYFRKVVVLQDTTMMKVISDYMFEYIKNNNPNIYTKMMEEKEEKEVKEVK